MSSENKYSSMNLYQKLSEVQAAVDIIQKDASGYGYRYVSEAEILPKINAAIREYGVTLYPTIVHGSVDVHPYQYTKISKKGEETVNEHFASANMVYVWVNNDNPAERIEVPWFMVGNQSDSSQAFGSALTYSERYFILKYFHVATVNDDPDKIRSEHQKSMERAEIDTILKQVDTFVQNLIVKNPDIRGELKELISPYVNKRGQDGKLVKTSNYFEITNVVRAKALLEELMNRYKEGK